MGRNLSLSGAKRPDYLRRVEMTRRAQARSTVGAVVASALVFAMLGTGSSGAATTLGFDRPVKAPGSVGFEPGIDIAADGTIFTNEPLGVPSKSVLYRSKDNGATYAAITLPAQYSRLPGGGDSDVETAIGPNGMERVYFLSLWVGSYSIVISDDNGDTWSFGSPLTSPVVDRAWIESGGIDPLTGEQKVYILTSTFGTPTGLQFSRSNDGGRTWAFHRTVPGIPGAGSQSGQLIANGDFLAFPYNSSNYRYVAISTDAGDTWKSVKASMFQDARGSISSMARDASTDALHTVWQSSFTNGVSLASSYDNGETWTYPKDLWSGGRSLFPWIDARDGKVAVVWFSSDGYQEDPNTKTAAKRWYAKYAESVDDGATFSAPITVGGNGTDNAVKKGAVCTNGLGCNNVDRDLGDFLQVAIDAQGRSRVAYGSTLKIQGASAGMHIATQKTA